MAKALELTDDTLTAPPVPRASQITTAPAPVPVPKQGREARQEPKQDAAKEPLQVRWPGEDVKAAKLAAIQLDFPSVSDFMLTCFHAYMKTQRKA
jgi:hypothetical protein